jgi:hypothetical protein
MEGESIEMDDMNENYASRADGAVIWRKVSFCKVNKYLEIFFLYIYIERERGGGERERFQVKRIIFIC